MLFGVSVEKTVSFRGVQQPFANVYYYNHDSGSEGDADSLLNNVKALEVGFHSTDVSFVFGRVWTAGGTKQTNHMVVQKNLSGTGNQATSGSMDRERAFLIRWPAGFDSRGHQVYLRKWFHSCGACVGFTPGTGQLQNTAEIPTATRSTIETAADGFQSVAVPGGISYVLRSATNRTRTGDSECHPWLEHHQLGDQWRGQ
jgi:hypothetical protein